MSNTLDNLKSTEDRLRALSLQSRRLLLQLQDEPNKREIPIGSKLEVVATGLAKLGFLVKTKSDQPEFNHFDVIREALETPDQITLRELCSDDEEKVINAKIRFERQPDRFPKPEEWEAN